ncbi:hypothetical protein F5X98DRAFT_368925 [Xylaria grammica]|nr:hypothetical protein F5X98DRAFT_368925 [Xylaria grammica]
MAALVAEQSFGLELLDTDSAVSEMLNSLETLPTNLLSGPTCLIDIKVLGGRAFTTAGTSGCTFKDVLESKDIPKVFFDFHQALVGRKRYVCGLAKCIADDAPMSGVDRATWKTNMEKGLKLFAPEMGGRYKVFDERPLRKEIREYCVQDTKYLPQLRSHYDSRLTPARRTEVLKATKARVTESQAPGFNGKGKHKVLGPGPTWSVVILE